MGLKQYIIKGIHILILIIILAGCKGKDQSIPAKWSYDSIQHQNELLLIHTDDRLGEWGGNSFVIRVYREDNAKQILLDYIQYEGKIGPPAPPVDSIPVSVKNWFSDQHILSQKTRIIASEIHLQQITTAIKELIEIRINNNEYITMAGVVNRVIFSDSSLNITDYPSTNWSEFQTLKTYLMNE